ncbi:hypothetical protein N9L81_06770, partial [Planktomarina temperata]|nr:hypothetical protein [Planktomarina temperata]
VQGENVFHLGALGAGHTTKLINNFMGMTTACTMSQAFAVAQKAGIDYVSGSVQFSLYAVLQKLCRGWSEQSWLFNQQR